MVWNIFVGPIFMKVSSNKDVKKAIYHCVSSRDTDKLYV